MRYRSEQYALFHHVSNDIAFYSLAMLNAASVFGRTVPNVRIRLVCLSAGPDQVISAATHAYRKLIGYSTLPTRTVRSISSFRQRSYPAS